MEDVLGVEIMSLVLDEHLVRAAMFRHLDSLMAASAYGSLRSADINTFRYEGRPLRLIVQSGIWKPAGLSAALTVRTTYTPPNQAPPYHDGMGDEGLVRYKYRGTGPDPDPNHPDNRALRNAMERELPIAYFVGVASGVYVARYPVWLRFEDPTRHEFAIALDEDQRIVDLSAISPDQRRYIERMTRTRLHQPLFRARVLHAYDERCAMCRLHHARLLDAAHIIPDGEPQGDAIVPNGLSLCKIHHAAYDANLLGVRPDLTVDVAPHILAEEDGPMLRHGLQEMAGSRLIIPRERAARPDPERLGLRYEQFQAAC